MTNHLLLAATFLGAASLAAVAPAATRGGRPTVVLVHGAFAGSSSWNGVIAQLQADGYSVVAVANPCRSVAGDAQYVTDLLRSLPGDIVLVGHSYGGEMISVAGAAETGRVKALVFVAGLALEPGESANTIGGQFPEGTLGPALATPVSLADGSKDLYIQPAKYWQQFAADVPAKQGSVLSANQRPVTMAALAEPVAAAGWHTIPSWFIFGERDLNIPRAAHAFMAKRAQARETVEIKGASHVVMVSHPREVAAMIERAATHP